MRKKLRVAAHESGNPDDHVATDNLVKAIRMISESSGSTPTPLEAAEG